MRRLGDEGGCCAHTVDTHESVRGRNGRVGTPVHCFARGEEGPLSRLGAVNKILAVLLLAVIGNCTLSDDHVLCEAIVIVPLIID